ncbi:MAG: hemolysin III family protein [Myxococcota bacterium]
MIRGERINSISHLVGAAFALAGTVVLIVFSVLSGSGLKLGTALVYSIAVVLMFLFSTLYHGLRGPAKVVFHRFDHIGIYVLIAGTYTPFCLVVLRDASGYLIFGIVWSVAILGIVFKSIFGPRYNGISTALYVAAGWTVLLDISTLKARMPAAAFAWLLTGGVLYTVGAVFFLLKKIPLNHQIWHFFVLAAAACHFVSVFIVVT